jgi:hypothetical protein
MECQFSEVARMKYRIRVGTTTGGVEVVRNYDQLREIHRTIKQHNPSAADLFPRYKLWKPVRIVRALDLEKFQQVSD